MSHQLSGGAVDTLFVLFWFGPRSSGTPLCSLYVISNLGAL
ncbi:hypothetical protein selz8t3_17 [Salmonella phage selz]|nr:hypothetical protein selz4t3_18 [Salmonella phage selz]UJQ70762.1 hypothetical protein selz8t1_17 [Salmonella phage selz]UJQ70917.1 hypothetical protein selz8t2_17 [Salmonella phage selz]UJQ71198.1 hypothetical protein selz8t3_17 [Salmonella phage selz]